MQNTAMAEAPSPEDLARQMSERSVQGSWIKKSGASSPAYSRVFLDTEEMKQRVKDALAKPSYTVFDFYHKTGLFQWIAKSQTFETATLIIIGFNALWLAHDTNSNDSSSLLDARIDFQIAEIFFCSYYAMEWFIRFMAFERKCNCLRDGWFVFDSILVFLMVGETFVVTMLLLIISQDGPTSFGFGNAGILRLFRLLRLTRMARMLRSMPELMILIKGMAAATTSVFFIMCLQLILLYVFAIAFTQLAADTQMGAYYFPNVLHSMYTLLLYGTFLDNLSTFCDEVGAESGLCLALIFVFVLLSACTVLNMLIGILCEVVNTVTTVEKEEMTVLFVTNKLQKVLDELDSNNDGQLSKEEFEHILQVPAAARALEEVGVDPVSIVDCGNFIFGEGGGTDLPFKKFMEVLLTLRADNKCTLRDIISLRGQVKRQLDSLVHRLCADVPNILGRRKAQVPHSRQQTGEISVEHESAEREDDGGADLRALEAKTDSLEGTMEEILGKLSLLSQHFEKPAPLEVAPAVASERPVSGVSSLRKTAQVEAFYLPKRDYAKEELLRSFRMRDSRRYLVALELALDAELDFEQIPCVYRLYRLAETFMLPQSEVPDASGKITAQLCLILDYGVGPDGAGARAEQAQQAQRMARVKKSLEQIVEDVKKFRNPSFPDASVDLELTAIAYSDWDELYGRPAVAAFGGREVTTASGPQDFNLGGQFTRDPLELQRWMGSGRAGRGSPCRELAGAWWAAAMLPWKAQKKLAVVITDAPCYGKDYSSVATADSRCDPRSGLTCTGRPEEPLKRLKDQGVVVSILHSGSAGAVSMCHTLQAASPELSHSKVHPSETARGLAHALEEQLHLQPLTYILKPHMLELSAETQLPPDSNLCVAHEMEVDDGGQTQCHTISSDGLFFLGSSPCRVTLQRPPDEKLDAVFARRSQAVELDGFFNGQKSYLLKMPPLRSAHAAEEAAEHFRDVRKAKVAR